ncbi:MAG: gliding motility-associated C-terminal domain-containing protein [Bacteroidales bacterium]|nr:gliding motility-associated C-terminal domain-containing protein [Bacteroidales bacterium]
MNLFKYIPTVILTVILSHTITAQTEIPDAPVFSSASIIPESNPTTVVLNWIPSDSLDVEGYIIYQVVSGITETIDTVYGRLSTNYSYDLTNIIDKAEQYRLAAFDDEYFKSSITNPHTTMFLSIEFDKCNTNIELDWTSYKGWTDGVKSYNLYRRSENGEYSMIKSLSADKLTYIDEDVDPNQTYLYYIEATSSSSLKATSNSVQLSTNAFIIPQYLYARYASVDGNNINLNFAIDNTAEVLEYRVQRSATADGTYATIQSYQNIGQSEIIHTDYDVNVNDYRYYYRLAAVNPCGIISSYSNICSNIVLDVLASDNLMHDILWTNYYAWPNGVSNFKVYRVFNDTRTEIGVNSAGDLDYSYNIEWYVNYCHARKINMTNEFCYYVEAYESESPEFVGSQGISRSNIACVNHYPVAWMPTAFNATSISAENRVFKPVLSFVEKEPYEFIIYDKWGCQIFQTNDTFEGWDGTIDHSHLAPSQYYTYFMRYYDHKNSEYIKTGTFFLLIE